MEECELPAKEFKIITKMSYELNKIMQELNENINKEIEKKLIETLELKNNN